MENTLKGSSFASIVEGLLAEHTGRTTNDKSVRLKSFDLAISVLREWRLDRYYMGKAKLFDVSWHARELSTQGATQ